MARFDRRVPENAPGEFYVDDTCIDCDACRAIAPSVFGEGPGRSFVARQPANAGDVLRAEMALISCPTASIGARLPRDFGAARRSFPESLGDGVYALGFHDERSYAASAYLYRSPLGNVLVDVPRFVGSLVRAIEEMGGVDLIFLTHRDDVFGHEKWAAHFGAERVMHADDVGPETRSVERRATGEEPIALRDDLKMIPVPGHSRGSACLLTSTGALFTGDHLAWDHQNERLYAFRDYCWFDWRAQIRSMERLARESFVHVLPGHGRRRRFAPGESAAAVLDCVEWMRRVA